MLFLQEALLNKFFYIMIQNSQDYHHNLNQVYPVNPVKFKIDILSLFYQYVLMYKLLWSKPS